MKKLRLCLCVLLCACLLFSCAAPQEERPTAPLPTAVAPSAPYGDAALRYTATVPLYLPSRDGQTLLAFYDQLTLTYGQHPAEDILTALLSHEGNSRVAPIGGTTSLTLAGNDPVMLTGGVCSVNLAASALILSSEELYTAAQAITATLCQLEDVDYVTIMIAGAPAAMDVGGNLPLGLLSASPGQELPILWEQFNAKRTPVGSLASTTPLATTAALYFPLADHSGVEAEPRRLSFPGQHPQQLIVTLLEALSSGAAILDHAAPVPDILRMMLFMPEVFELEGGGRRVNLYFSPDVLEKLREQGSDPICFFTSITLTLTSFVPSLQQVCILAGDAGLTSVPSDAQGTRLYPGALHTRDHDHDLVMSRVTFCLPGQDGLTLQPVSMPYRQARSPRQLLLRLAQEGAWPAPLTDADIQGISVQDGTLLINLSERYGKRLREADDQRMIAYSAITTLCEALELRRVRFYFGGSAVTQDTEDFTWSGEFMYRPGMGK